MSGGDGSKYYETQREKTRPSSKLRLCIFTYLLSCSSSLAQTAQFLSGKRTEKVKGISAAKEVKINKIRAVKRGKENTDNSERNERD